jgi:hypothetical protein
MLRSPEKMYWVSGLSMGIMRNLQTVLRLIKIYKTIPYPVLNGALQLL